MSKRARYVGGDPDGVTVDFDAEGQTHTVTVKHGGELPEDIETPNGKVRVPAAVRDSLLDQGDDWTEVKRSNPSTSTPASQAGASTTTTGDAGKEG